MKKKLQLSLKEATIWRCKDNERGSPA